MGECSFFISTCILVGPGQGSVWKLPHREVDESYPGEYWMFEDPCKDELAWTLSQRFQHVFAVNSRAGVNLVSGRVKVVPFLLGRVSMMQIKKNRDFNHKIVRLRSCRLKFFFTLTFLEKIS